jgi:hypothetical protein
MTTDLQQMLGEADGARQLDQWFCDAMRGGDLAGLDAFLAEELAAHPHPLSDRCRAIAADAMTIIGWDEFYADYVRVSRPDPAKPPLSAVGIDMTMHADPDGDDWGLETSFYDDHAFAFSSADIAAINVEAAQTSTEWQGAFRDLSHALSLRGAGRLYAALTAMTETEVRVPGEPASVGYTALRLGWLFLCLRFHQALVRAIADVGMPAPLVVLGGCHDIDPFAEVAYRCDRVADGALAQGAVALATRQLANKDGFRREAAAFIDQWRDRRNVILRNQLREDKRQDWIDYCTASDALNRNLFGLGEGAPVHLLSDYEFEQLLYRVRLEQALKIGDDPASVAPPPPRRGGLLGLFRRAA